MAQNIFQQNVSNLYGTQQQQEYDQLKQLQQERQRTQGLQNLYNIMMGKAPTFGGTSVTASSTQEGPSRAEIETEALLQEARDRGVTTTQGLGALASEVGASYGATDALRKQKDLFDLGDLTTLYTVDGLNVAPLNQQFQTGDISGIRGAVGQGAFRSRAEAEAFAMQEALKKVNEDLRQLSISNQGDINQNDIEKLKIRDSNYVTNPILGLALTNATQGMNLNVGDVFYRNKTTGEIVTTRAGTDAKYKNDPNYFIVSSKNVEDAGEAALRQNRLNNARDFFLDSENGTILKGLPEKNQKALVERILAQGVFEGLTADDTDDVFTAIGGDFRSASAQQKNMTEMSRLVDELSNPANLLSFPSLRQDAADLLAKSASVADPDHFETLKKVYDTVPSVSDSIKTEKTQREAFGGISTFEQSYYLDSEGKKKYIGEPVRVLSEQDNYTVYMENGKPVSRLKAKVFDADLKLVENILDKEARLPKVSVVYDYGMQPFLAGDLTKDSFSAVDDNLITALVKARDDSMVTVSEYELQLQGAGLFEKVEYYKDKIVSGERLTAKQRRAAVKILTDIYKSSLKREKPVYEKQKKIFDAKYGSGYVMAPYQWKNSFEQAKGDEFALFASLAGVNSGLFNKDIPTVESIYDKNADYFKVDDPARRFEGTGSVKTWKEILDKKYIGVQ